MLTKVDLKPSFISFCEGFYRETRFINIKEIDNLGKDYRKWHFIETRGKRVEVGVVKGVEKLKEIPTKGE